MGDQGAGRREARGGEGAESRAAWGGAVNGREAQRERPVGRRWGGQKEWRRGAPAPLLRNAAECRGGQGWAWACGGFKENHSGAGEGS